MAGDLQKRNGKECSPFSAPPRQISSQQCMQVHKRSYDHDEQFFEITPHRKASQFLSIPTY